MIKHPDRKQLKGERVYFSLPFKSIIEGGQGRNSSKNLKAEIMEEHCLLTDLFMGSCLASSLYS